MSEWTVKTMFFGTAPVSERCVPAIGLMLLLNLPTAAGSFGVTQLGPNTEIAGLSDDGERITFRQLASGGAFVWNPDTGVTPLELPPGQYLVEPSGDGQTVLTNQVGYHGFLEDLFLWRDGASTELGLPPLFAGFGQMSARLSFDGSTLWLNKNEGGATAYRWDPTNGYVNLPTDGGEVFFGAGGVTADGSMAVGWVNYGKYYPLQWSRYLAGSGPRRPPRPYGRFGH